jgi:short-subunit dehydrogenase
MNLRRQVMFVWRTLRACQVFGRHMIERSDGRIINIASMGSFPGAL